MAENDIIARIRAEGLEDFIRLLKDAQAQTGKLGDNLDDAGKEADDLGKKGDKLSAGFKKLGAVIGAAFATQQLIQYTKYLAKLAVQLDATDKKFKTVFGSASKLVEDFAKKSATSLGLTESQYKAAAAAAGDLLIPMKFSREEAARMSAQLINLSGALSAWTGGQLDAQEVSRVLTKALLGEREELKTLGISIQEADVQQRLLEKGQNKLTGTTLQQAKATATLELIMEKSTDAQAAFADGTKTLAEKQLEVQAIFKNLSDRLADKLIPAYSKLLDLITAIGSRNAVKEFVRSLEDAAFLSQEEVDNARESLLLYKQQLEERKKSGKISVAEAIELENRIPAALKRIAELEAERTRAIAGGGRGIGQAARERYEAELEASKAADEEERKRQEEREKQRLKDAEAFAKFYAKAVADGISELSFGDILDLSEPEVINIFTPLVNAAKEVKKELADLDIESSIIPDDAAWDNLSKRVDIFFDEYTKGWEEATQKQKDAEDDRNRKISDGFSIARQSVQGLDNIFEISNNRQLALLEEKNRRGELSDKEYQRKKTEILRKQARQDKATAIFSAIINTAEAVTKALPNLILAGIAAGIGATQIGVIASQPIPQFAKGTKGKQKAPAGFAWVGEQGPELMQMKGGEKIITAPDSDKLMKLLAGYGIPVQFNNPVEQILSASVRQPKNGKDKGIDWMPLLSASDRQRLTLGKKLDRIYYGIESLNGNLTKTKLNARI